MGSLPDETGFAWLCVALCGFAPRDCAKRKLINPKSKWQEMRLVNGIYLARPDPLLKDESIKLALINHRNCGNDTATNSNTATATAKLPMNGFWK